jgi:arginase
MKLAVVTLPYNVLGKGRGGASGPAALVEAGLIDTLVEQGHQVLPQREVELTPQEEGQYGGWNRVALAGGRLSDEVAKARAEDAFVLGLLADCNGVLGMLGGLQRQGKSNWPKRVGLMWIDAHGDYNTPETSPSGMLGGMPVAVAAGKALHNLRKQSGVVVPLQPPDIIMAGMRDLDPPEQKMMEEDGLEVISEQDLITLSPRLHKCMEHLSQREDIIYVHVDLDILDPSVAPAAGLPSPGGLTGEQLGRALAEMLSYPKVAALAVVSYNNDADKTSQTLDEVLKAITLATKGLAKRK